MFVLSNGGEHGHEQFRDELAAFTEYPQFVRLILCLPEADGEK
jgi:hypothetical protein